LDTTAPVLLTGSAGRIGTALWRELGDRFRFRGVDAKPTPGMADALVADLADWEAARKAVEGCGSVVHLAAKPSEGRYYEEIRPRNFDATYNIFEAARQAGIQKLVFASTNHVTGMIEKEGGVATPSSPIRPDSLYGVSKAFGEALGRYLSDNFGISVICLRIGNFPNAAAQPDTKPPRSMRRTISPRDLAQLVRLSLETELPFGIFYGVSGWEGAPWDITNARELLGYEPQDGGRIEGC
jgi:nucleoside-diphosphate-sugar epimerase